VAYRVEFTKTFADEVKCTDKALKLRVEKAIEKIKAEPTRFKRLHYHHNFFSVRIENFRLIYKVEGEVITLLFFRKRSDAYRNV
jgi:mRNA-degrading endonuclease RelE of RelBE toxin-antitoxin system